MVDEKHGVTTPRAVGQVIEAMLERAAFAGKPANTAKTGMDHWQSWQKHKELSLLSAARGVSTGEAGLLN